MRVSKIGVVVRIGRSYDYQTVVYEQTEEIELDETDNRDHVLTETRDRAFREVIAATNKAYDKLIAVKRAELK